MCAHGRILWALLVGLCAGLMHATKETCLITFGCLAIALVGVFAWQRRTWCRDDRGFANTADRAYCSPSLGLAVLVSAPVLLRLRHRPHTASGTQSRTYPTYFQRAGGHGPARPPLALLPPDATLRPARPPAHGGARPLILALATIGMIIGWPTASAVEKRETRPAPHSSRFLALYALLMTLVLLRHPLQKPPGACSSSSTPSSCSPASAPLPCFRWAKTRPLPRSTRRPPARNNSPPRLAGLPRQLPLLRRLPQPLRLRPTPLTGVVRATTWNRPTGPASHPDGHNMLIKVIASDPWPLPWYLRSYERVGYWGQPPADADAPRRHRPPTIWPAALPAAFKDERTLPDKHTRLAARRSPTDLRPARLVRGPSRSARRNPR